MLQPLQTDSPWVDAYFSKLGPDGTLLFSTYWGGFRGEQGEAMAADGRGGIVVAGLTESPDFGLQQPLQPTLAGGKDNFILRLRADGSAVDFSTYLGGRDDDQPEDLAIDGDGRVYVVGFTRSDDYPLAMPYQSSHGGGNTDQFVSVFCLSNVAAIERLSIVDEPAGELTMSWREDAAATEYRVYSGTVKRDRPATPVGTSPAGMPALAVPAPVEPFVLYQVVGADLCGEGPY